jgi:hypothetical protein
MGETNSPVSTTCKARGASITPVAASPPITSAKAMAPMATLMLFSRALTQVGWVSTWWNQSSVSPSSG